MNPLRDKLVDAGVDALVLHYGWGSVEEDERVVEDIIRAALHCLYNNVQEWEERYWYPHSPPKPMNFAFEEGLVRDIAKRLLVVLQEDEADG